MNKLVMVLSAALGLHASFAAHSAELMANGTKVVFWQGCNEDRLRFSFDAQ